MPFASLRRYDVQARYACVLSLLSVVPFLAAATLVVRNYRPELGQIVYGAESPFLLVFLGCVFLSMIPGVLAFVLGLSSAGQRRNDRSACSWIGFFVGGGVSTCDLILLMALIMLRLAQPM